VGIFPIVGWVLYHLPNLVLQIPWQFYNERFTYSQTNRSPFSQRATPFQDIVIRYVRYGFANLPASFGRVFLSKAVSLPFIRWRMLRHGFIRRPVKWCEVDGGKDFKALYIPPPSTDKPPSHIVFYVHGGGFAMGSSYFYLEFLLAWHETMCKHPGFPNPAIIAVEYTLVPDETYPKQLNEVVAAYNYTAHLMEDRYRDICFAGDSAGATLILSLLLHVGLQNTTERVHGVTRATQSRRPGFCVLISPWPTLSSDLHENTKSDYLNAETLELYGERYLGHGVPAGDLEVASPGLCTSSAYWARASPSNGYMIIYGTEEVLAKDAKALIKKLISARCDVYTVGQTSMVHAWPVAALYLADTPDRRLNSIRRIVDGMYYAMEGKRHEIALSPATIDGRELKTQHVVEEKW
jgi:acetyl esterase/lipase